MNASRVVKLCVLLLCPTLSASQDQKQLTLDPAYYELYEYAWNRLSAEQATQIDHDEKICFKGIDSVGVLVSINDGAVKVLSEQRARDRFELMLRGYGVPVSEPSSSDLNVMLSISAVWDKQERFLSFLHSVSIYEPLIFYRDEKPHKRFVVLWEDESFGHAGHKIARSTFLEAIEEKAERVANLYLSANPGSMGLTGMSK